MYDTTKAVESLANEWKDFDARDQAQAEKIEALESEIKNIKGELPKMQTANLPEVLTTFESKQGYEVTTTSASSPVEFKSFSSDNAERGAHAISPERCDEILAKITEISPMRNLASVDSISSNVLELLIQDGDFANGWVAEDAARDETDTPKLIQKRISVHEVYSQPKATQRLVDDNVVNFDSWLTSQLVESFARAENKAFISGDGNEKPKGFLTYDEIERVAATDAGKIAAVDLLNLLTKLDETYHANASFLMNRRTLAEIQKITDADGRFIWQPSLSEKMPATIFGIPVYCSNDMPEPAQGKSVIALADFKRAYKIVDRSGMSLMKDPFTEKPFIKFYSTKRVGGDVVDLKAIKLLKI